MTAQLSRRDVILAAVGAAIASAGTAGFPGGAVRPVDA